MLGVLQESYSFSLNANALIQRECHSIDFLYVLYNCPFFNAQVRIGMVYNFRIITLYV